MLVVNFRLKKSILKLVVFCALAIMAVGVLFSSVKASPKGNDALDRLAYLSKLGYGINDGSETQTEIKIPSDFDEIYSQYNETQKVAGFNLLEYSGESATMYTYSINNYKNLNGVYANLIVANGKIIGGDISSIENGGFTLPLVNINEQK